MTLKFLQMIHLVSCITLHVYMLLFNNTPPNDRCINILILVMVIHPDNTHILTERAGVSMWKMCYNVYLTNLTLPRRVLSLLQIYVLSLNLNLWFVHVYLTDLTPHPAAVICPSDLQIYIFVLVIQSVFVFLWLNIFVCAFMCT